jgi:hypothetical protein
VVGKPSRVSGAFDLGLASAAAKLGDEAPAAPRCAHSRRRARGLRGAMATTSRGAGERSRDAQPTCIPMAPSPPCPSRLDGRRAPHRGRGMPAWAVLRCPHHPCPSGGDESWPNTGTTPRGRAQNSKRRSHPWPGGLGGDHQHPAARSASTAARAAIFAEHVYPSARSFEPKLQPGAMTGGLRRLITLAGTRRSPAGKTTPTHASPLFRHCPGASRCCPLRAYLACDSRITDGVAM